MDKKKKGLSPTNYPSPYELIEPHSELNSIHPYSLVFEVEMVLPLEIPFMSLRVATHEEIRNEGKASLLFIELEAFNRDRLSV